jgi:membrane-bound lytic murein transglycosylase
MSEKKKKKAIGRRDFFKKAGLGAGAVGAAAVGLSTEDSAAAETTKAAPGKAGYSETAHVKKYYELARF